MDFNTKKLELMCKTIDTFPKEEHIKILEIIRHRETSNVSENNNGTFIHMEDLSQDTLIEIENHIQYVLKKETEINSVENTKEIIKNNINNILQLS